ncbi:hypothetical protein [Shewanella algidipiscicola]|uniref:hypothetical protein n=1 Tax=Shewanella algidipiscicola TaxID=614070 RepID=UPI000D789BCA|nr:hypothetical protein [Shewanella algidipiscicola]
MYPSKFDSSTLIATAEYLAVDRPFPSFQRLANALGVTRATIYNWRATKPDFETLCQHILLKQALWNSAITQAEFDHAVLALYQS